MTWQRELLDAESAGWERLQELLAAFAPEIWERAGVCGDWSVRDVLAMSAGARDRYRTETAIHPDDAPEGRRNLIHMVGGGHYDEHIEIFEHALAARA